MIRGLSLCLCSIGLLAACGDDGGGGGGLSPTSATFRGTIESIDEDVLSWEGLRMALICQESHTSNGRYVFRANQEYRAQNIGEDGVFSFDLPKEIEDGFVGEYPFDASSCNLIPVAYNDAGDNESLDCDPEVFTDCEDPIVMLGEGGHAIGLVYVIDPSRVMGAPVERGWNFLSGMDSVPDGLSQSHTLRRFPD